MFRRIRSRFGFIVTRRSRTSLATITRSPRRHQRTASRRRPVHRRTEWVGVTKLPYLPHDQWRYHVDDELHQNWRALSLSDIPKFECWILRKSRTWFL